LAQKHFWSFIVSILALQIYFLNSEPTFFPVICQTSEIFLLLHIWHLMDCWHIFSDFYFLKNSNVLSLSLSFLTWLKQTTMFWFLHRHNKLRQNYQKVTKKKHHTISHFSISSCLSSSFQIFNSFSALVLFFLSHFRFLPFSVCLSRNKFFISPF
jgi:hypothetical protein